MRKLTSCFIPTVIVILTLISCLKKSGLDTSTDQTSFDMKVTFAPKEVKSTNGKINLLYSVELLNFEKDG
ncbi:MAG: hypothetical protein NTY07_18830, partial [Bacteroidia bacterium]|nr:hypothetical protein [Bacteroidia bacterium]